MGIAGPKAAIGADDDICVSQALIGRQPILNREGQVVAFELLFRPGACEPASPFDGNRATANVVVNALTEIGLDQVVGPLCVNLSPYTECVR